MKRQPAAPKRRSARFIVDSFAVVCPHCGGAQPNQDGSEMWTPDDLRLLNGRRNCCDCDNPIMIDAAPKSAKFDFGVRADI